MDIHLPAINGLSAAMPLAELPETTAISIVAVTSCALEGDEQRALDSRYQGYITKPINTRTFIDQLVQLLPQEEI